MKFLPFLNYHGRLSEGATYNKENNSFLWVDIIAGKLHRVFLSSTTESEYSIDELKKVEATHEVYENPNENFGVIFLTKDDDLVLIGCREGVASFDFRTKKFEYVTKFGESGDKLRSNDGNIDPLGNIWIGLTGDFQHSAIDEGKLIKIDKSDDNKIITEVPNSKIPNGINWSKDGKTLYWTSSLEYTIYKFDYDLHTGEISNKRPHIKIKDWLHGYESPEPDGFTLTEDDHLYTAVFSTSLVLHFDPQGQLVEQFKLPAERITSVIFGGVDQDELYITSANLHLDDPSKLNQTGSDLGGAIFRIKLDGVKGPTYNKSNNSLLWVDIIEGQLHRVFLSSKGSKSQEYPIEELTKVQETHEAFDTPDELFGVVFLTKDDDLVLIGGKRGIATFNFRTKKFEYIIKYPKEDYKLRSNDGNIDPRGNIWIGLMGDFENGPIDEGKLIKVDKSDNNKLVTQVPNALIPNGINWSQDGKTLYWTSSLDFIIYKFDYDLTTGEISNQKPHIKIKDWLPDFESPEPDGFTLTEDEHIYTAVFSTSSVLHFDSQGQLIEIFKLPAERITSVIFGGDDLDELFITSANLHLDDPTKLNDVGDDLGGAIFRIKLNGVKGILKPYYEL
ncbi:Regucalcin [Wickerhamomyces ciferrii]|uniref:Regucalcin n=1 Tax=Wickerhamomyces ciferrii (strain ATCC 14091 / BCRC 22168 / CBS 111 / JCM 3599 / NBRC 0793 / NRRL Y-1031 F-60-10) TaxID=1206466 RepID=K0KS12_WICCF|nr:Regucalcin [Wickerhamomyces ciferrii]CCH45951.1 Regucalcin [Wickerhamomyces ciferrii]